MSVVDQCSLGCHQLTTGEFVAAVAAPFLVAGSAVAAEAAVADVAVPTVVASAKTTAGRIVGAMGLGACNDNDCLNEASEIVKFARDLQGSGLYPGVDEFTQAALEPGNLVAGGLPGQSNFYTTIEAVNQAGSSAETLWTGLQVIMDGEIWTHKWPKIR